MALSTTRRGISVSGDTQHGTCWCHHCLRLFWKKPPGHLWNRTSQIFTCTPITGGSCENADSDIAGLEWGLRLCTANELLGAADVVGPETRLNIKELEAPEGLINIKH